MCNLNCEIGVRLDIDNLGGIKAIDIINEIKKIDARIISQFQTSLDVIFTKTNRDVLKLSSSIKDIMKLANSFLAATECIKYVYYPAIS